MLRTSESETEILLGNKQLLGIFFAVAVLLGIAFAGGYMVGHSGVRKTPASSASTDSAAIPATGGETHSVAADPAAASKADGPAPDAEPSSSTASAQVIQPPSGEDAGPPLGARKAVKPSAFHRPETPTETPSLKTSDRDFTPQNGQTFLQVAAVERDDANAIADVLRRKGFHAHSAPRPGSVKLFRVLVGPLHDASDLSSTREALRKSAGFREVIVQKY